MKRLGLAAVGALLALGVVVGAQQARVLNSSASLAGKTLVTAEDARTITGLFSFSRGVNPPFAVNSGAGLVTNLNADQLDGLDSTALMLNSAVSVSTSAGTLNDFGLPATPGLSPLADQVLLMNNSTLATFTGFTAPSRNGTRLHVFSVGAGQIDLAHQNTGSGVANRLINAVTGTVSLSPGKGRATYIYNTTDQRWRLLDFEQGTWITPAYSSGVFTASAGTWTVESGDRAEFAYRLDGTTLSMTFRIDTASTSGGMGTDLRIALPNPTTVQYTAARFHHAALHINENAVITTGYCVIGAAATFLTCNKESGAAWTSSLTNTQSVWGGISLDLQ